MEKAFHVQRITAKIKATERSIDEAISQAADLMIEMKAGQEGFELGAVVTDPAFAKLSQAIAELTQARSSVVATHKRLVKIHDMCGLQTTMGGIITMGARDAEDVQEIATVAVAS